MPATEPKDLRAKMLSERRREPASELEKHIVRHSSRDLLCSDVWRRTFSTRDGFTLKPPRGPECLRRARTYHGGNAIFLSSTQREAGTNPTAGDGIDRPDGWSWLLLGGGGGVTRVPVSRGSGPSLQLPARPNETWRRFCPGEVNRSFLLLACQSVSSGEQSREI